MKIGKDRVREGRDAAARAGSTHETGTAQQLGHQRCFCCEIEQAAGGGSAGKSQALFIRSDQAPEEILKKESLDAFYWLARTIK